MKRNKSRFYLAYVRRQPTRADSAKYHVGLILSPKKPKSNEKVAMMYHATNQLIVEDGHPVEKWRFQTKLTEPRTVRLVGCMLLGKVATKFKVKYIAELLTKIHVPSLEDEKALTSRYSCREWVSDALLVLQEEGIISKLPGSPAEALEIGRAFVEKMTNGSPVYDKPLYTCDTSGTEIASEIEPYN